MVVSLIFISLPPVSGVRAAALFSWLCFLSALTDPSGRDGAQEHPRERTRTGGREPTRPPVPQMVPASAGTNVAVRLPWTPRNRLRAARAGALKRSAATYEADLRSLQPTVVTRPADPRSRDGSARQ